MRKFLVTAGLLLVVAGAFPSRAAAQTFFSPFVGATFKGDAPATKLTYGAGLTFMARNAGLELEFGYTPDFFNQQTGVALISDSNVTTAMASIVFGPHTRAVRPYGVVGAGLLRSRIGASSFFTGVTANDVGLNAGIGVRGNVAHKTWIRGELRYFRSLQDSSNDNSLDVTIGKFDFLRAIVAVDLGL